MRSKTFLPLRACADAAGDSIGSLAPPPSSASGALHLKDVSIFFKGGGQPLLNRVNAEVAPGCVLSVMGESGSGKSTLLNFITGIIDRKAFSCEGEILLGGRGIHALPVEARRIGLLVQDYLLFPHMSVAENLLFALPRAKRTSEEKKEIVARALREARIPETYARRYPATLSGGQQARVALMRTLLSAPEALLLDEPFSRLDQSTRTAMRDFVFGEIARWKIPAVLVTHDAQDIADERALIMLPRYETAHEDAHGPASAHQLQ